MGACPKLDAPFRQRVEDRVNIRDLEVNHRPALARLSRRGYTDQQADVPGLEEAHLGWGRKQEAQAEPITVEDDRSLQILNGDEKLSYSRV
jgi:hypothetical protein